MAKLVSTMHGQAYTYRAARLVQLCSFALWQGLRQVTCEEHAHRLLKCTLACVLVCVCALCVCVQTAALSRMTLGEYMPHDPGCVNAA